MCNMMENRLPYSVLVLVVVVQPVQLRLPVVVSDTHVAAVWRESNGVHVAQIECCV